MSTDSPRPERVTLSAEERGRIDAVLADPDAKGSWLPAAIERTVERILAAREQALREEIAGQIEERVNDLADELGALVDAQHPDVVNPDDWLRDQRERIARGETR